MAAAREFLAKIFVGCNIAWLLIAIGRRLLAGIGKVAASFAADPGPGLPSFMADSHVPWGIRSTQWLAISESSAELN